MKEERKCHNGCSQLSRGYCYAHSRGGNVVLKDDGPMCGFNERELNMLFNEDINFMYDNLLPLKKEKG